MERDISKLPAWARSEITRLRQDNEDYKRRLTVGPVDGDTFADPTLEETRRPLGTATIIQFGSKRGERITCQLKDGVLYVRGDERITIRPVVSNVIEVSATR